VERLQRASETPEGPALRGLAPGPSPSRAHSVRGAGEGDYVGDMCASVRCSGRLPRQASGVRNDRYAVVCFGAAGCPGVMLPWSQVCDVP
jgi:hypothetical protein